MGGNEPGPSNASKLVTPCVVFFVVTPCVVGIRFWSRLRGTVAGLWWDDWLILGSSIASMLVSAMLLRGVHYGYGKHVKDLTLHNQAMALKFFWICQVFYKITFKMTKCSILCLYLRFFIQRKWRICCYVLIAIIVAYGIASLCTAVFQCIPVESAWDKRIDGTCLSLTDTWYANSGFSIATDVLILLLPMPLAYSLTLPIEQKIGLMMVFGVGGIVVMTSVLRMTTIDQASSPDATYDISATWWGVIESNIGIICACLPMIRPLLSIVIPKVFPRHPSRVSRESYIRETIVAPPSSNLSRLSKGSATLEDAHVLCDGENLLHLSNVESGDSRPRWTVEFDQIDDDATDIIKKTSPVSI